MPFNTPKTKLAKSKYHHYVAVNYRGYTLYWIILIALFACFIALPFINVDVSVQSRGTITTLNKMVQLSSPITAKVTAVNISENKNVNSGDTLVILQQSGIINEIGLVNQQLELQVNYITDISQLLNDTESAAVRTTLYQKEYEDYITSVRKFRRKIDKLGVDFKRTSKLFKEGVVPLTAYQEDSFKLEEARDDLMMYKSSSNARWETERRNYIISNQELKSKIENLWQQHSQYQITAPFDGSIIDFNGVAVGNFVTESQLIAYLSPQETLIAECYISPSDIGFIQTDMPVRLQIDTYDYNQWGMLDAVVLEVADDVSLIEGHYMYLIRCRLEEDNLQLSNGVVGRMKKGMSLTGRFIVTQRSLFQLLFDTVDDWLNPKVLSNEQP
ncbi:MAG: HlyD family secretion protein [Bacteroidales bacterium]|nr:HlyD family secretion protein [Bacteroidales bacterium]